MEDQKWRAVSFDEMRLDDKTHGDGGDRAGRTERSVRCSATDDGECVGNKHGSHTASLMGGSNAAGDPTPPFVSLACTNFDPDILSLGPVATINGRDLGTQGICNPKGSINGAGAISFISDALIPMFDAYGQSSPLSTHPITYHARPPPRPPLSPSTHLSPSTKRAPHPTAGGLKSYRRGVLTCDCVGTHMTTDFLEFCCENHMQVCLRTPMCSQAIQFEDIDNFWQFKNAKDTGWCVPALTLAPALAAAALAASAIAIASTATTTLAATLAAASALAVATIAAAAARAATALAAAAITAAAARAADATSHARTDLPLPPSLRSEKSAHPTPSAVPCCRYKLKQQAIFKQMALTPTKNPNLSHAKQLELMVPAWNNAFSKKTNERAWRRGGFGKDGITMAPLWQQLKKEQGEVVDSRARSASERARLAADLGLKTTFEFDKWLTKPYEQNSQALEKELDADAEGEDEDEGVKSTRLPVAELQRLR